MTGSSGEYNKNVPAHEYRYSLDVGDDGTITAVRSDETLTIGTVEDVIEMFDGETYVDDMGIEIDIPTMLEEITLPRLIGDELRTTSPNEMSDSGVPERVMTLVSALHVSLEHGFERRSDHNTL